MKKIVVAVGGASGSIYAKVLLDRLEMLKDQVSTVGVVMSDNAKFNWTYDTILFRFLPILKLISL